MMPEDPAAKSYRELAAKCRDMATRSSRPACLVMRAEHYEAMAARLNATHRSSPTLRQLHSVPSSRIAPLRRMPR